MKVTIELTPKILDMIGDEEIRELINNIPISELKELILIKINNNTPKPFQINDVVDNTKRKRFEKYPEDMVKQILNEFHQGKKVLDISIERQIPESTIYTWIKLNKINKQQEGRNNSKSEASKLANEILDDPFNDLKRINELFPPITDEVTQLVQHQVLNDFNKHKKSIKQLADENGLDIPTIKRIIYNN